MRAALLDGYEQAALATPFAPSGIVLDLILEIRALRDFVTEVAEHFEDTDAPLGVSARRLLQATHLR